MKKLVLLLVIMFMAITVKAEDDTSINLTGLLGTIKSDVTLAQDYYSNITIGTYTMNVDDLRSLSEREATKLAACLILLNNSWWTEEMKEAICEKFIPKRFKIK